MDSIIQWLILFWVLVGHLAICCAAYNQTHASASPRKTRKAFEKFIILFVLAVATVLIYWRWNGNRFDFASLLNSPVIVGYQIGCLTVATLATIRWIFRKVFTSSASFINQESSELFDVKKELGSSDLMVSWDAKLLGKLPFNQSLDLVIEKREFRFASLPDCLQGFKVALISDLHFTGKIAVDYYGYVVERCNEMQPDLICICGDIVDEEKCLDWIEQSIAKLEAKYGVFYVLGNHDRRVEDTDQLRETLARNGIHFAGNQWQCLQIDNCKLMLAGNELPWFSGSESLPAASNQNPDEFYLLMSHSPDQISFASERNVDLMLAGHTHGGQIRLPWIGPIVAPSRHGVKYASGSFRVGNTVLHVSRGISGDDIIRINCPPEMTLIELTTD